MPTDIHPLPKFGVSPLNIFEEGVFCRKTIKSMHKNCVCICIYAYVMKMVSTIEEEKSTLTGVQWLILKEL